MKELCKLAEEKGFQCHTFSTRWIFDYHLERGKKFMVNKECNIILLAEIQYWLVVNHMIHINLFVNSDNEETDPIKWYYSYICRFDNALHDDAFCCACDEVFNSYEEALEKAILVTLDLIICQNTES